MHTATHAAVPPAPAPGPRVGAAASSTSRVRLRARAARPGARSGRLDAGPARGGVLHVDDARSAGPGSRRALSGARAVASSTRAVLSGARRRDGETHAAPVGARPALGTCTAPLELRRGDVVPDDLPARVEDPDALRVRVEYPDHLRVRVDEPDDLRTRVEDPDAPARGTRLHTDELTSRTRPTRGHDARASGDQPLQPGRAESAGRAGRAGRARTVARVVGGRVRGTSDAGMATAEYAIATVAAVGFAGLLVVVLRSGEVQGLLLGLIRGALSV
jgi:hypothetical protein